MTESGVVGIGADADADADREPLRLSELDADLLEVARAARPRCARRRRCSAPGPEEQELVGAVSGDDRVGLLATHQLRDPEQHLVGGFVAVRVVEQAEVVHVDERDADGPPGSAGRLELLGQAGDDRRRG